MKLYIHFCAFGFNNCYVVSDGDKAIIIDPGSMDENILKSIEDKDYALAGILVTHGHSNHVHGIRTLKRIYSTEIFCVSPEIQDFKTITVRDGESVNFGSIQVDVIAVPGHSADSAVFKIGQMLFTGDALSAGLVGRTASIYGSVNQMTALRGKILSLPGDYTVFPGHGPPTSLDAERRFNAGINGHEDYNTGRSRFRAELYF